MKKKIMGIFICMLLIVSSFYGVHAATGDSEEPIEFRSLLSEVIQSQSLTVNANEISADVIMSDPLRGEDVANPSIESGGGYDCCVYEYKHDGSYDIGVSRKTEGGSSWVGGYFDGPDGVESIPDIDYWGSGKKFYGTATYSNTDDLYYIEIEDISGDPTSWKAWVVDFNWGEDNVNFYDSNSVACYSGQKTIYALIGTTDLGGVDHVPWLLYEVSSDIWSVSYFPNLEGSSHISIDIDQNTGVIYLAFERANSIYLLFNDYDDGLNDDWEGWRIKASDYAFMSDIDYPDVSAGHGVVYMTAQAYCGDSTQDWDPWYFHSEDDDTLYFGWLLGTSANEKYPRVSLTYTSSHVVGNWIYTKNNALYSSPDDKVSGSDSVSSHYRASDVAFGHAAWTISSEYLIHTTDISVGDYLPHPFIDSISPNPAGEGDTVSFNGLGWDPDGWVTGYKWVSDIDGELSIQSQFSTSSLSVGTHTISFTVKDNNNIWSLQAQKTLVINENIPPTAYIDSISPNPAYEGETVHLVGHGTDPDGSIIGYNWRSDIYGQLSTAHSYGTNGLSVGIHTIYFKVKDDNNEWSAEVESQLEIMPVITWTIFKPLNATGDMDYPNPYTNCYHANYSSVIPGSPGEAISSGNNIVGSIGGYAWGWNYGGGSAHSFQNISFYVGSPKSVDIYADLIISYAATVQWGGTGYATLGHSVNNIEYLVDYELIPLSEFDIFEYWVTQLFFLTFGIIPEIGIVISYLGILSDYYQFLDMMEPLIIEEKANPYSIDFGCSVSEGFNTISIGGKTLSSAGDHTYTNTSFFGIVKQIKIDGIAPPRNPCINGPSSGQVGESIDFTLNGFDPNDDDIQFGCDWNGGGTIEWTEFIDHDETITVSHSWDATGDYTIRIKTRDIDLMESDWTNYDFTIENRPPETPQISGEQNGEIGEVYEYTFIATDPDEDDIYYYIDWKDGTIEEWIGPHTSGQPFVLNHAWEDQGIYRIEATAKDIYGAVGETGYLAVTMPQDQPQPCFLAGTQITMADGSFKNIEDIVVGDIVLSVDRYHSLTNGKRVSEVFHHTPDEMGDHYLIINGDLCVTPNHLLYINDVWKQAENVIVGDYMLGSDGERVDIVTVEQVFESAPTFNFAVESSGVLGSHTCFVQGSLVTTKKDIVPVLVQDFILHSRPSYKTLLTV